MGCQTTYSPPITIPTGNTGAPGAAGAAGSDGIGVFKNTAGTDYTSGDPGDQLLVEYETVVDGYAAGDILNSEVLFTVSTSFVGKVYLKFGTTEVASYTVPAGLILPVDPVSGLVPIILKSNINFKTAATEAFDSNTELATIPAISLKTLSANCSEDTETTKKLAVRCNPSAGTAVCKQFLVTLKKV